MRKGDRFAKKEKHWAGGVAQVERAPSSNSNSAKNRKRKRNSNGTDPRPVQGNGKDPKFVIRY
jgi:hypothetical protein